MKLETMKIKKTDTFILSRKLEILLTFNCYPCQLQLSYNYTLEY